MACGADVLVLAAATGADGYDARPTLDDSQWATLLANLDRLAEAAADRGVLAVLHPHVGTMVETRDEVDRVLDGSAIRLCLDTGHLLIGGTDPLQLAREVPDRIAHAHLKDVDAALAARVQAGELTYTEAVGAGCTPRWAPATSTSPASSRRCGATDSTAGSSWSRTPSSTASPTDEGPLRDVRASVAFMQDTCAGSVPV